MHFKVPSASSALLSPRPKEAALFSRLPHARLHSITLITPTLLQSASLIVAGGPMRRPLWPLRPLWPPWPLWPLSDLSGLFWELKLNDLTGNCSKEQLESEPKLPGLLVIGYGFGPGTTHFWLFVCLKTKTLFVSTSSQTSSNVSWELSTSVWEVCHHYSIYNTLWVDAFIGKRGLRLTPAPARRCFVINKK